MSSAQQLQQLSSLQLSASSYPRPKASDRSRLWTAADFAGASSSSSLGALSQVADAPAPPPTAVAGSNTKPPVKSSILPTPPSSPELSSRSISHDDGSESSDVVAPAAPSSTPKRGLGDFPRTTTFLRKEIAQLEAENARIVGDGHKVKEKTRKKKSKKSDPSEISLESPEDRLSILLQYRENHVKIPSVSAAITSVPPPPPPPKTATLTTTLPTAITQASSPLANVAGTIKAQKEKLKPLAKILSQHFPNERLTTLSQVGPKPIVPAEGVHAFVDFSNLIIPLLTYNPHSTLSKVALCFLLTRGRQLINGTIVASEPLPIGQNLDAFSESGWSVHLLQRVKTSSYRKRAGNRYNDSSSSDEAAPATQLIQQRGPFSTGLPYTTSAYNTINKPLSFYTPDKLNRPPSSGVWKEQMVDELLTLHIFKTITKNLPGTLVVATGDAAGSEYNEDGFLGAIDTALNSGWCVEVVSWRESLGQGWRELERLWSPRLTVVIIDDVSMGGTLLVV